MGTDLAVIDAEVVDSPEPLSEGKARVLDKRVRQASVRVADNNAELLALLEKAANGQIHVALGFPSWTAWVKDAVRVSPSNEVERKSLVQLMSGKGVSQRATAAVLDVNQSTVSRILAEGEDDADASPETTGTDGKTYKRKPKEPKQEPLDVEEVEAPVKVPPVSQDFRDEMWNLANSVTAFNDILADERFPKARNTIAKNNLNKLGDVIKALEAVRDALMES